MAVLRITKKEQEELPYHPMIAKRVARRIAREAAIRILAVEKERDRLKKQRIALIATSALGAIGSLVGFLT